MVKQSSSLLDWIKVYANYTDLFRALSEKKLHINKVKCLKYKIKLKFLKLSFYKIFKYKYKFIYSSVNISLFFLLKKKNEYSKIKVELSTKAL